MSGPVHPNREHTVFCMPCFGAGIGAWWARIHPSDGLLRIIDCIARSHFKMGCSIESEPVRLLFSSVKYLRPKLECALLSRNLPVIVCNFAHSGANYAPYC
jgi:hypothetical protein